MTGTPKTIICTRQKHNPQGPETGTEKVQRDGGGVTMTFSRLHSSGEKKYYLSSSFRCALQQKHSATQ